MKLSYQLWKTPSRKKTKTQFTTQPTSMSLESEFGLIIQKYIDCEIMAEQSVSLDRSHL